MARQDPHKNVVIVGLGWTGSIVGMELANQGLEVLALERGEDRDTVPDFQYPKVIDELKYGVRLGFMQKPSQSTLTVRRTLEESALPYRVLGSFLPGNGVGGAGMHWNGLNWRLQEEESRSLRYLRERGSNSPQFIIKNFRFLKPTALSFIRFVLDSLFPRCAGTIICKVSSRRCKL